MNDSDIEFDHNDLKHASPFKLIYQKVSDKTVRRDIKKLESLDLIRKTGTKYRINFDVL